MESQPNLEQDSDSTRPGTSSGDEAAEIAALVAKRRSEQGVTNFPPRRPHITAITAISGEQLESRIAEIQRQQEEQAKQEREWQRQETWGRLVRDRGERYAKCRLANYRAATDAQRAALEFLNDYATNIVERISGGVNVLLLGPAGTGKDHLQMGLCWWAVKEFRSVQWVNGTSLWVRFRQTFGDDAVDDEQDVIDELTAPDVLAISDPLPPRGPLTDYQASMLFEVIDSRYSRMKPTWVTLNVASREEAEQRIGAQVVDRLGHGALVVKCNWKSYRREQPQ